jgi:hypothetical protein
VNFLFDPNQKPHLRGDAVSALTRADGRSVCRYGRAVSRVTRAT